VIKFIDKVHLITLLALPTSMLPDSIEGIGSPLEGFCDHLTTAEVNILIIIRMHACQILF